MKTYFCGAFVLALTASTRNRSRSRMSRSMVLLPMEPVAPRSVTVRSLGAGTGRSNARRDVSGFITSPHQQTAARRLEPAAQQPDQRGYNARGDEAVEAVHQSAVARDEMA